MHSRKNNSPIGELGSKQKRDKDGGIKKTLSFISQGYIQRPEHLMQLLFVTSFCRTELSGVFVPFDILFF